MGCIWFDVCWRSVSVWLWWCGIFMQSEALLKKYIFAYIVCAYVGFVCDKLFWCALQWDLRFYVWCIVEPCFMTTCDMIGDTEVWEEHSNCIFWRWSFFVFVNSGNNTLLFWYIASRFECRSVCLCPPESHCFKPKDESFRSIVHFYGFIGRFGLSEHVCGVLRCVIPAVLGQ